MGSCAGPPWPPSPKDIVHVPGQSPSGITLSSRYRWPSPLAVEGVGAACFAGAITAVTFPIK